MYALNEMYSFIMFYAMQINYPLSFLVKNNALKYRVKNSGNINITMIKKHIQIQ